MALVDSDKKISQKFFPAPQNRGITLIESLVGSVVFVLVALTAYQVFGTLMDAVLSARAKVAAASLANEQFEIIRNLPYEDIGVVSGLPSGKIPREQVLVRDGYSFEVTTTIRNVDDTFDGTIGGTPSDSSPADYKSVDLDITCSNCKIFPALTFTTLAAPYALETASTNGALFIQVIDAEGMPVSGASVHIVNSQPNPDIVIDELTDNGGWVKIIDAPPGVNAYNITATKEGYTTDQTYPLGGAAGTDPINPDVTVVVQQVSQTSLSIDRVTTLNVSTVDGSCVAVGGIEFSLTGTKLIGLPDIIKFPTEEFSTDLSGDYEIDDLEWDIYSLEVTSPGYHLAGVSLFPILTVNPNENLNMNIVAIPALPNSLLVSVQDENGIPIDGASVELENLPFTDTKSTGSGVCSTPGQVFWNGLLEGNYTLRVSKTGYQTDTSNFNMTSWQNKIITLTPNP